jgi:two-component system sensor histidine kinase PilS (NtrC family)
MTAMESALPTPGLSKAEGQATVEAQNWKLLKYFNFYRLAIAIAASAIAIFIGKYTPFGEVHPGLFLSSSVVYAIISLTAVFAIHWRKPDYESQATLLSFSDITLLTIIMHSSGGLDSGLGLMLVVAIAGASLMLGKRLTIFYASLATSPYYWNIRGAMIGVSAGRNIEGLRLGCSESLLPQHFWLPPPRPRATRTRQRRSVGVANLSAQRTCHAISGVVIWTRKEHTPHQQSALKYLGIHKG